MLNRTITLLLVFMILSVALTTFSTNIITQEEAEEEE